MCDNCEGQSITVIVGQHSHSWNYKEYTIASARTANNTIIEYNIQDMFGSRSNLNKMQVKVWLDAYVCSNHSKQPNAS